MARVAPSFQTRSQQPRDWGNYASLLVLPNAAGWLGGVAPAFPLEEGDTAYVIGSGPAYCVSAGVPGSLNAVWSLVAPAGIVTTAVEIDSFVQATLTGGGYNAQWSLAFGHTAVSMLTPEAATTKAPRRLPIGSNAVAANAAALTQLTPLSLGLGDAPVFINPGEFIAVVKKKVGTAPSAGTIAHMITIVAGWE